MTLLLLGGTRDAKRIASALLDLFSNADGQPAMLGDQPLHLIYSVAGLVRLPDVDCEVICGGFSQYGGLEAFARNRDVAAIIDATHPYAQQMTAAAVSTTRRMGIEYWRFQRSAWSAEAGDDWQEFSAEQDLLRRLDGFSSLFWTAGQLSEIVGYGLQRLHRRRGLTTVLRSAARPQQQLPDGVSWVQAIGPFAVEHERQLFEQYQFDVLVSKNSGGNAVAAKLQVAREYGIPVFMLARPKLPEGIQSFSRLANCIREIGRWLQQKSVKNLGEFAYE